MLMTDDWGISYEIARRWLSLDLTADKSSLVQIMARCHQATCHCLNGGTVEVWGWMSNFTQTLLGMWLRGGGGGGGGKVNPYWYKRGTRTDRILWPWFGEQLYCDRHQIVVVVEIEQTHGSTHLETRSKHIDQNGKCKKEMMKAMNKSADNTNL